MIAPAHRLQDVEEYYFSKKLKEVALLNAKGHNIINLGVGSPDLPPPNIVVEALQNSLQDATAHKYQSYQGLPQLREAIAAFYNTHYKVSANPENEILPLLGSKEGIMHISMAFVNKGDKVLVPNPGYITYASVTKLVEATPVFYDLKAENNWLPDFDTLEQHDLSKVKLMWISYPHMPTGANAGTTFFDKCIAFGRQHNILVINDNPYSFILNNHPKSLLSRPHALETCMELNSLSKVFNISGWRVGMLLGNASYIDAVLKVKTNMDSGMFYAIQKGAIAALKSKPEWFENLNKTYQQRRQLVWTLAKTLGCTIDKNNSGLFVWAKLPNGQKAEVFSNKLLYKHHIFAAPGTIFGTNGEGYLRFSLCEKTTEIKKAIDRL